MDIIKTKIKDWKSENGVLEAPTGATLNHEMRSNIAKFYGIPGTLVDVDEKYKTDTLLAVLNTQQKSDSVNLLMDNDKIVSVLDPRSSFVQEQQYYDVIAKVESLGLKSHKETRSGASIRTTFDVDTKSSNKFLNDIFTKNFSITRNPEGGIYLNLGLLRLACTNGMMVTDSAYSRLIRNLNDPVQVEPFVSKSMDFSVDEHMKSVFTTDGEFYIASVADFMGMRDLLAKMTDKETADEFYPTEEIKSFYTAQGVDVSKLSRTLLNKLPSGVSYYQAFNILTNAAKSVEDLSLADEIAISSWMSASKLKRLKISDVAYKGMPHFDEGTIKILMGDYKTSRAQ